MLRILVTGSKGFIGRHLILALKKKKLNFISYNDEITQITNFKEPADLIFHLVGKRILQENPLLIKANIEGTKAILEYAQKHKSSIIFPSTAAVYGFSKTPSPFKEENAPDPNNAYGFSKLEAENLIKNSGIPAIIFRIFNVFGPFQSDGWLIPYALKNLFIANEIQLKSPENVLDFIFIEDVIKIFLASINRFSDASIKTFNLGTGIGTSVREIVMQLETITKKKAFYSSKPLDDSNQKSFVIANTEKLKNEFKDFNPIPLKKGLQITVSNWAQ